MKFKFAIDSQDGYWSRHRSARAFNSALKRALKMLAARRIGTDCLEVEQPSGTEWVGVSEHGFEVESQRHSLGYQVAYGGSLKPDAKFLTLEEVYNRLSV